MDWITQGIRLAQLGWQKFLVYGWDWMLAAGAPAGATRRVQDPRAQTLQFLIMMALLFVIMYLVLIRPQQKKEKEHRALLQRLKPGDKVVTSSGICGVILHLKDQTLTLRSGDSKLEVLKSSVVQILEKKKD